MVLYHTSLCCWFLILSSHHNCPEAFRVKQIWMHKVAILNDQFIKTDVATYRKCDQHPDRRVDGNDERRRCGPRLILRIHAQGQISFICTKYWLFYLGAGYWNSPEVTIIIIIKNFLFQSFIMFSDEQYLKMFNESYETIKFYLRKGYVVPLVLCVFRFIS